MYGAFLYNRTRQTKSREENAMSVYDGWKQQQLQQAAAARGLSAAGTNEEIKARLEQADAAGVGNEDLLGDGDETPPAVTQTPTPPVDLGVLRRQAAAQQTVTASEPPIPAANAAPAASLTFRPEVDESRPRAWYVRYEVRGDLGTSTHEDNRHRAYNECIHAGYTPRGGLAGVSRVAFETGPGGVRLAVYEVLLSRR